jgi:hypothetical protein
MERKSFLDGQQIVKITSYLTMQRKVLGHPYHLISNKNKAIRGLCIYGAGFILEKEEVTKLITKNPKNKDVIFPYLTGQDLNTNFDQSCVRSIINFKNFPIDKDHDDFKNPVGGPYASDYPDCLEIAEKLVKPERKDVQSNAWRQKWWQYASSGDKLDLAIQKCRRVLVRSRVSNIHSLAFVPSNFIFSDGLVVFAFDNYSSFVLLQSIAHTEWLNHNSSSMRNDVRYTPTDCFETFPFPDLNPTTQQQLEAIGENYYNHRQKIMTATQLGLTKTYNRFHDPNETDPEIEKLRQLHIEMDNAVATAYNWNDLLTGDGLNHDFHQTKQGLRFTISEQNRREILDRLLQLNHQRYAEEVKQGLHDKTKKKASKAKKSISKDQLDLKF